MRGNKLFELSNHLGNVLTTVSDRKIAVASATPSVIDYYKPDIISAQDYYPFGMMMPERKFSVDGYRYGFNGKENDNEVKGEGNQQDYGMRVYDPRIAKFLSVDPLQKKYPDLTPFQFASNSPIANIDLDGLERFYYAYTIQNGHVVLTPIKTEPIVESTTISEWRIPRSAMNDGFIQTTKLVTRVNQRQEHIVVGKVERSVEVGPTVTWKEYEAQAVYSSFTAAQNFKESDLELTTASFFLNYGEKGFWNVIEEGVGRQISAPSNKPTTNNNLQVNRANGGNDGRSTNTNKGTGEYKTVGGHHVHAKAAFKSNVNYDSNKGFSISQSYMNEKGWNHQAMTNKQRELFKKLSNSGKPNTMSEHSNIAVEALQAGGATLSEARKLVAESLNNLRNQGVTVPNNIPWYK